MGLIKNIDTATTFIDEDKYVYPNLEIIIQTTRNPNNVNLSEQPQPENNLRT